MSLETTVSTTSPDLESHLLTELNDEMTNAVLPVSIFVGIETVFGFFGNLLILYVFLFRYHPCNFKYFVLCLAVIDITSTLTTMPGEIVTQVYWYVYPFPVICKIKSFFNVFTVCGSAFCLLLIAVDRFRKICRPLKWQIKPNRAIILCFVLLGVSFLVALPVGILWGTQSYQETYKDHKVNVTICEKDGRFLHTGLPLAYTIAIETIISSVMLVLFILYIFVCRMLFRAKSRASDITPKPVVKEHNIIENETSLSHGMTSEEDAATQSSTEGIPDSTTSDTRGEIRHVKKTESQARPRPKIKIRIRRPTIVQQARRIRRKTLIMFILTAIFIVTTVLYLTLLSLIANDILRSLNSTGKTFYFLFFRLYFINHVINPILYGFLDPHFRRILKQTVKRCSFSRKDRSLSSYSSNMSHY